MKSRADLPGGSSGRRRPSVSFRGGFCFLCAGNDVGLPSGSRRGRLLDVRLLEGVAVPAAAAPAGLDNMTRRQRQREAAAWRVLLLWGLLEATATAAGGGRSLPQFSDDVLFRVNWPGSEFSLVGGWTDGGRAAGAGGFAGASLGSCSPRRVGAAGQGVRLGCGTSRGIFG